MKNSLTDALFLTALVLSTVSAAPLPSQSSADWRTDPGWHQGRAEWALYDASRVIYGRPRPYEATIFTNVQLMDPATTTKAADAGGSTGFEVFKHNVSEMVPTENYTYRFLTTSFVHRDTLTPYKVVMSSQEDCGATYRQIVVDDGTVEADEFCYFPEAGRGKTTYRRPGRPENFAIHDALSLTLRDYPFDAADKPLQRIKLVPDQTHARPVSPRPEEATIEYAGRETVTVPYGAVDTHHLRIRHASMGGATTSEYWFSAEPNMRNVLVQYEGPYGVRYALKRLAWWAYWQDPMPAAN